MMLSLIGPLSLSFDKKVAFHRHFKTLLPSIGIVALFYIAFDIYFTHLGVWGFNARYHLGISMAGLPLEEWLFFIIVPFASIFLHQCIVVYFPKFTLGAKPTRTITYLLIGLMALTATINITKAYTLYISAGVVIALAWSLTDKSNLLGQYYLTFLAILVPFLTVNGILTGSFIDEPVVWYNNAENLGIRFFTIPIEDFGYGFSLILFSLRLQKQLEKRTISN